MKLMELLTIAILTALSVYLLYITRGNSVMSEAQRVQVRRRNRERLGDMGGWR